MNISEVALVVEDQVITSLDLKNILKFCGYSNIIIKNKGGKAIEFIEKENISIALLDIKLADEISGIEVARRLKQKNTPFIFVAAFSNPENLDLAKALDPLAIIKKPIDVHSLKNVLFNFHNSINNQSHS